MAVERMASRTVLANRYRIPIRARMTPCRITARAGTFHVGLTAAKYSLNGIPPVRFRVSDCLKKYHEEARGGGPVLLRVRGFMGIILLRHVCLSRGKKQQREKSTMLKE